MVSREERESERERKQGSASGRRGCSEMDLYDAVRCRSDSKATADLPADDAGHHDLLCPTSQHPTLLCLTATARGRATSHGAELPSSLGAVDAACTKTTTDAPRDVPTVDEAGS